MDLLALGHNLDGSPRTRANARPDGGPSSTAGNGANHRAHGRTGAHALRRGRAPRTARERVLTREQRNGLAVHNDADQFELQLRAPLNASSLRRLRQTTVNVRALGDNDQVVDHQRLLKRGLESVANLVAVGIDGVN